MGIAPPHWSCYPVGCRVILFQETHLVQLSVWWCREIGERFIYKQAARFDDRRALEIVVPVVRLKSLDKTFLPSIKSDSAAPAFSLYSVQLPLGPVHRHLVRAVRRPRGEAGVEVHRYSLFHDFNFKFTNEIFHVVKFVRKFWLFLLACLHAT